MITGWDTEIMVCLGYSICLSSRWTCDVYPSEQEQLFQLPRLPGRSSLKWVPWSLGESKGSQCDTDHIINQMAICLNIIRLASYTQQPHCTKRAFLIHTSHYFVKIDSLILWKVKEAVLCNAVNHEIMCCTKFVLKSKIILHTQDSPMWELHTQLSHVRVKMHSVGTHLISSSRKIILLQQPMNTRVMGIAGCMMNNHSWQTRSWKYKEHNYVSLLYMNNSKKYVRIYTCLMTSISGITLKKQWCQIAK